MKPLILVGGYTNKLISHLQLFLHNSAMLERMHLMQIFISNLYLPISYCKLLSHICFCTWTQPGIYFLGSSRASVNTFLSTHMNLCFSQMMDIVVGKLFKTTSRFELKFSEKHMYYIQNLVAILRLKYLTDHGQSNLWEYILMYE